MSGRPTNNAARSLSLPENNRAIATSTIAPTVVEVQLKAL
jgi:hypothetical protein